MRVLSVFENGREKEPVDLGVTDTRMDTQASWAIGNDPPLYAHMPLLVLRSHTPGRRPRAVFVASGGVTKENESRDTQHVVC